MLCIRAIFLHPFATFLSNLDVDDCIGHSCTNGATCVDAIAGYSCQCQAGYVGTWCETGEMMSLCVMMLSDMYDGDNNVS